MQWAAQHLRLCRYWFSFVSVYAAVTCNVFNGPDNSLKLPLHVGELDPHIIHCSLSPPWVLAKWHLKTWSVIHVFSRLTSVTNRHTQGETMLLLLSHAMRHKNKERNLTVANWCPDHPCCRIKIKFCMDVVFPGSSVVQSVIKIS